MLAEHVEAVAAHGLDALRAGAFPLGDIDREHVATFMAAQLGRGRVVRNNLTEALAETMSMALSIAAQNADDQYFERILGRAVTAEERERMIHNHDHMRSGRQTPRCCRACSPPPPTSRTSF